MSHSKPIKRGRSLYLESWNPDAKRFINTCKVCGHRGYSPSIDEAGFCDDSTHRAIRAELTQLFKPLYLDEWGRCEVCAKLLDEKRE